MRVPWPAILLLEAACLPVHDLATYSAGVSEEPLPATPSQPEVVPIDNAGAEPEPSDPEPSDPEPSDITLDAGLAEAAAPAPEAAAPGTVSSHFPPDGASGVASDVTLVITFAQAMNEPSVAAAIETESIPMSGASFAWTEGGRVLSISLAAPLAEATGEDPNALAPICYSYRVSEAALDVLGHAIQASGTSFCTQRRLRRVLLPVLDRDRTGNWRSNDTYGDGDCSREGTNVCVGDSGFVPNAHYQGFITFDTSVLGAVPANGVEAVLQLEFASIQGDPFATLGQLILEQVQFDAIGSAAFVAGPLQRIDSFDRVAGSNLNWTANVGAALRRVPDGAVQFRLSFESGTDADGAADHLIAAWDRFALRAEYRLP